MNESLPEAEKIKVISISHGAFSSNNNYQGWLDVCNKAEALGIFVITCNLSDFDYGTLIAKLNQDPVGFTDRLQKH